MNDNIIKISQVRYLDGEGNWQQAEAVYIKGETILSIGSDQAELEHKEEIKGEGRYLLPGLSDLNVAVREPGNRDKGTIASETAAAAAGGVTRLCCPPDSQPVNDSHAVSKLIGELATDSGRCEILPIGALTKGLEGEQLAEYASLKRAGCVAVSNAYRPIHKLAVAKRCFEYAKTQALPVFINPIEPSLYRGSMHEGEISTTIGLQGVSSLAETVAVAQYLQLAEATGVTLHLSQLSCADSVSSVRNAKAKGLKVSADVALQNLLYTDSAVEDFNSVFHTRPPLRAETDRQALLEGVKDGTIDAITSAHQPHEATAKLMPFGETEPGMSMVEHLLPLALKLEREEALPFHTFIRAMNEGPCQVLHLTPNRIEQGAKANLVLFDPDAVQSCDAEALLSTGKNSPLLGTRIKGAVCATLLAGTFSYRSEI